MSALDELCEAPRRVVAICGAAVSGSEAAAVFAERDITPIVFEQNVRPYGKIEDGLPRWHVGLRNQEYKRIDDNLVRDGIVFVPSTTIGRDIALEAMRAWGLNAIILANGAWRDRPLGLPDIDRFVDRGLVYQNPFVYWFNHYEEPGYDGPTYEIPDGPIVVGGGLASVDVIKIVNLELYRAALRQRGHALDVVELEHKGIAKTLEGLGLSREELGVEGCTLFYRRRVADMPLASPKDASPEALAKAQKVREKMVSILQQKYFVNVRDLHVAAAPIEEDGRLVGLVFRRTQADGRKLVEVPGSEVEVRSKLVISSIGSIPLPLAGVPMKGELYDFTDWDEGTLRDLDGVFGLGNVLTGKGNIKDSRLNARDVAQRVIGGHLHMADAAHADARERAESDAERIAAAPPLSVEQLRAIVDTVKQQWQRVGYEGDYASWIGSHKPA